MRKIICLLLFLGTYTITAQKKYSKEFSLINDNDLFISTSQDRYYTNGIFLSYKYLAKSNSKAVVKKINEWQLSHLIYTPHKATVISHGDHDRPFAAYFYGSFASQWFYKNNSSLKASVQLGMIGPSAKGQQLQDFIHDLYGFKKAIGWKYQIKNALGLNLEVNYTTFLVKDNSNHFDIHWINNAKAGTVFTDVSTGFIGRIGFKPLQQLANSIAFNSNLNNDASSFTNEVEVFLYTKPILSYVAYDATIQGSFLNTSSPITFSVMPLKFTLETGIHFTANRFNFGYAVFYHTKKLKSTRVPKGNFYGSIQINYQFN